METRTYPSYPNGKRPELFREGMEFEDFVREKCAEIGLQLTRFSSQKYQYERGDGIIDEIKLDNLCTETKRLSIEIAEKSRADNPSFVSSGIYAKGDFWLYIQGNEHIIFIFPRNVLQRRHLTGFYREHQLPTIRKFYLPMNVAFKLAMKVIPIDGIGEDLYSKYSKMKSVSSSQS